MQKIKNPSVLVIRSTSELSNKLFHCSIKERVSPMPLHIHEFYEIHLVVDGSVNQKINGELQTMHKGDFYFLNPFDLHEYTPTDSVTLAKCQFDLSIISQEISESLAINNKSCICNITGIDFETTKHIFEQLKEEEENDSLFNSLKVTSLLNELLIIILRHSDFQRCKVSNEHSFNNSLIYIHNNYMKDITLETVSDIAGFTPNYFCVLFKNTFGVTLKTYVRSLRLNRAVSIIKTTNYRVSDIAYMCGYNSFSQFSAEFKAFTGKTPIKFRRESSK